MKLTNDKMITVFFEKALSISEEASGTKDPDRRAALLTLAACIATVGASSVNDDTPQPDGVKSLVM